MNKQQNQEKEAVLTDAGSDKEHGCAAGESGKGHVRGDILIVLTYGVIAATLISLYTKHSDVVYPQTTETVKENKTPDQKAPENNVPRLVQPAKLPDQVKNEKQESLQRK